MEMDDDDEFGDLYTDVLLPVPAPLPAAPLSPSPSPAPASPKPASPDRLSHSDDDGEDQLLVRVARYAHTPPSSSQPPTTVPGSNGGGEEDWILGQAPIPEEQPMDWNEEEDGGGLAGVPSAPVVDSKVPGETRVLETTEEDVDARVLETPVEEEAAARVLEAPEDDSKGEDAGIEIPEEAGDSLPGGEIGVTMEIDEGIGESDDEPVIPGLSAVPASPGAFRGANGGDPTVSRSEEWDSDSEDDLQIVLNDDNLGPLGGERNGGFEGEDEDDEDGEDDLVIVTDGDRHHHHHQVMEEQEWGDESMQPPLDGERKEMADAVKGIGGAGAVAGARIGYSGHGFHTQHHSQFKYVRPGAATISGGAAVGAGGAPGQARPPLTVGLIAGRGRGAQKSFHSGYGLAVWASNTSSRGLEFTLPSHKTIFEIDIDTFEEKPWRHPGVDISDFFNFGLDENRWKDYCKQLEQLRLEATMQSKIRVYESGRSEHDYDPDLPPELAAATGLHDISTESTQLGKLDGGQGDSIGQGRGAARLRPQLPIGRAIQVEGGYGERLPSMDTRPPRTRDSDAIIEIVLQDSFTDSTTSNSALEQPPLKPRGEEIKGGGDVVEEDDRHGDSELFDRLAHTNNVRKRESATKGGPPMGSIHTDVPEGNGILPFPPEVSLQRHPKSKSQSPMYADDHYGEPHGGRRTRVSSSHERHSSTSDEHSADVIPSKSPQVEKEKSGDGMEDNQTSEISPAIEVETARDLSIEQRDDEQGDRLALGDSAELEGEETTSDLRLSGETHGENDSFRSVKQHKLSSQVEQPAIKEKAGGEDSRATHSDSSRAKSGSSKDYLKRREAGDEEVIQGGRSRRMVDLKRHRDEDELSFRRRDDYGQNGRYETEKSRVASKDLPLSNSHREWDSSHYARRSEGIERSKERDASLGVWQRRDDDIHGRRLKDDDSKRDHSEEIASRQKSKLVSERKGKDEDLHSRKHLDDGDRRGRHDREGGPRQRDRDDILISRRDNFDDLHTKRRKDEEQTRREKAMKEDTLHGYRPREDTVRAKRETDDVVDRRKRDDLARVRDKTEDHHSVRHQDDSWRQREREDRHRLKQPHEDTRSHMEREEVRSAIRSGRVLENKPVGGSVRTKDESKGLGSDKDHPHKDRRRHNEPPKRGSRVKEETSLQNKAREDMHTRENRFSSEERSSRHERLSGHNDRPSASDGQQMQKERHKGNSRNSKENEGGEPNSLAPGKRKREDQNAPRSEKKGRHHTDENPGVPEFQNSSMKHGDDDVISDDENHQNSRRGRSKLERWTSHKERDYSTTSLQSLSTSLRTKEAEGSNGDTALPKEFTKTEVKNTTKTEGNTTVDSDPMDADVTQLSDKMGEERDRHLDTVEKLKKRSERFKLPMPGEKEITASKKTENEVLTTQSETITDTEIKQERPARKRRWTSS